MTINKRLAIHAVALLCAADAAAVDGSVRDLLDAAKHQEAAAVGRLLKQGVDVNAKEADGATALHWVVYWDDVKTASLLISAGAQVNASNDLGVTPLLLASTNGSPAMVARLLEAGADPAKGLSTGETPLMTASRTGNADVVRLLLKKGADINVVERTRGQTALMWAVAQEHPQVVAALLEHGADIHARSRVRRQLVNTEGNAKPEGDIWVDQGGFTPLLFAARNGNADVGRLLLSAGANVDDAAPSGASALAVAAHSGHRELSLLLLQQGADPNAEGAGYTALHAAILRGDAVVVQALLEHGADPNAPLRRGTEVRRVSADWHLNRALIGAAPYWLAAKYAEPGIMRLLAAHGAERSQRKGAVTALMAAIIGITYGAQIGQPSDRRGRPYYASAAERSDPADEERLTLETVRTAVELGADVNAIDDQGVTALHAAAGRGLPSVIEYLATAGARLDAENVNGQTPLGIATKGPRAAAEDNAVARHQDAADLLRRLGARE